MSIPSSVNQGEAPALHVRKVVHVRAPRDVAFQVFTAQMSSWWPLVSHKIGKSDARAAVVEPRQGGRWYEVGVDGVECEWGKVLAWEPPSRLLLAWQINAGWQFDAALQTEVEVRFVAESADSTRVELEHRNLERFGERAAEMRGVFESEGGWGGMLNRYAEVAGAPPVTDAEHAARPIA